MNEGSCYDPEGYPPLEDPYVLRAAKEFRCEPSEVTSAQRQYAKQLMYSEQYVVRLPMPARRIP